LFYMVQFMKNYEQALAMRKTGFVITSKTGPEIVRFIRIHVRGGVP
jgi:hypothetical protein